MKTKLIKDLLKVVKKKQRECEFELHNKSINYGKIIPSKKKYKRKKYKYSDER